MTRTEKVLRIAKILSPNAVDEHIRRTMLSAEYILEVAYTTEEDSTTLASYHASNNTVEIPKEVPVSKPPKSPLQSQRSVTISAKKDWGSRRVATKPKQDRQDLISLLKSYGMHYGFSVVDIGAQARRQGYDFSTNDIQHWFKGDNLPGDYKFDQIMKFLELNDRDRTEENKGKEV